MLIGRGPWSPVDKGKSFGGIRNLADVDDEEFNIHPLYDDTLQEIWALIAH